MTSALRRSAFTLLELVVVITIIAILTGIGLLVGTKVVGGGKSKATTNVLQTLDQALSAYTNSVNAKPPASLTDDNGDEFPLADATVAGTLIPSTSYLIEILEKEPSASAILKGLPSEFVERITVPALAGAQPQRRINNAMQVVQLVNVKDAWGRPIRFVHPKYQGDYANSGTRFTVKRAGSPQSITLSRDAITAKNADGGLCAGGRPYFYSAGPDGDPSTREDNIYSSPPTFASTVTSQQGN